MGMKCENCLFDYWDADDKCGAGISLDLNCSSSFEARYAELTKKVQSMPLAQQGITNAELLKMARNLEDILKELAFLESVLEK